MGEKLFGGVPDVRRVVADTGLDTATVEAALLELAWITKTASRLGKGYMLGGSVFCRPDTPAQEALRAATRATAQYLAEERRSWWLHEGHMADALADRTGLDRDEAADVVVAVADQLDEHGGTDLRVTTRLLEIERVVEDQLMENPSVLAPWGWSFGVEPTRQVRLGDAGRADIVGQLTDGSWLVIELKRGAALAETAQQVLRYIPEIRSRFADGAAVRGLVVADGDDPEFHATAATSAERVDYLPVRALDLPACRPQSHKLPSCGRTSSITVAADGVTVVAGVAVSEFAGARPDDLWFLGRDLLDGTNVPVPIEPLDASV